MNRGSKVTHILRENRIEERKEFHTANSTTTLTLTGLPHLVPHLRIQGLPKFFLGTGKGSAQTNFEGVDLMAVLLRDLESLFIEEREGSIHAQFQVHCPDSFAYDQSLLEKELFDEGVVGKDTSAIKKRQGNESTLIAWARKKREGKNTDNVLFAPGLSMGIQEISGMSVAFLNDTAPAMQMEWCATGRGQYVLVPGGG